MFGFVSFFVCANFLLNDRWSLNFCLEQNIQSFNHFFLYIRCCMLGAFYETHTAWLPRYFVSLWNHRSVITPFAWLSNTIFKEGCNFIVVWLMRLWLQSSERQLPIVADAQKEKMMFINNPLKKKYKFFLEKSSAWKQMKISNQNWIFCLKNEWILSAQNVSRERKKRSSRTSCQSTTATSNDLSVNV